MNRIDLNLLLALKALIDEESVSGAARSLDLSPSAMSRTLARVQDAIGDKVLVRAGKGMVATETARRLKEPLDRILQDVELLL
ncbi:LysR family transcriptional regulator, partial [Clostridioides difficile]|nr:LysR family transcriptional regulator [Clostridioides difficile]